MSAGKLNLIIEQGATFSRVLTWKVNDVAVNLTGYTARMHVRDAVDSTTTQLELSTTSPPGGIALGGSAGTITLTVSAAVTAALTPGNYVYDLELVSSGGVVTRLVEGDLEIVAEVTR